jgi:hypothetical protein
MTDNLNDSYQMLHGCTEGEISEYDKSMKAHVTRLHSDPVTDDSSLTIWAKDGKEVARFAGNGDIYVHGKLATNDMELVRALKEFLFNGRMPEIPESNNLQQAKDLLASCTRMFNLSEGEPHAIWVDENGVAVADGFLLIPNVCIFRDPGMDWWFRDEEARQLYVFGKCWQQLK